MTSATAIWTQSCGPADATAWERITAYSPDTEDQRVWRGHLQTLNQIHQYEDDWDGLDGVAPSIGVVDTAFQFLGLLRENEDYPPDRIAASSEGGIVFEWQDANGSRYVAEILEAGLIEHYLKAIGKPIEFFDSIPIQPAEQSAWAAQQEAATSRAA